MDVLLKHKADPHAQNKVSKLNAWVDATFQYSALIVVINHFYSQDELTPLHLACLKGNVEVAEILVMHDPGTLDMFDKVRKVDTLHLAMDVHYFPVQCYFPSVDARHSVGPSVGATAGYILILRSDKQNGPAYNIITYRYL